jgi:hypothetical protein
MLQSMSLLTLSSGEMMEWILLDDLSMQHHAY